MTRQEAIRKLEAVINKGYDRIKYINLARKYSKDIVEYDYGNPLKTISEMSRVISFLLRKFS